MAKFTSLRIFRRRRDCHNDIKDAMKPVNLLDPHISLEDFSLAISKYPECLLECPLRNDENDVGILRGMTLLGHIIFKDVEDRHYWEKLNLVLQTMALNKTMQGNAMNDGQPFLILHSYLEFLSQVGPFQGSVQDDSLWLRAGLRTYDSSIVLRVLKLIKENVPEQFRMCDTNGCLPLHILVGNWRLLGGRFHPKDAIEFILTEFPEAVATVDGRGQLPLHIAMASGNSCYDMLVAADVRALVAPCPVTGFYPFQLAAVEDNSLLTHEDVYNILRECPQLLKSNFIGPHSSK